MVTELKKGCFAYSGPVSQNRLAPATEIVIGWAFPFSWLINIFEN
jgi:hypothetical protein